MFVLKNKVSGRFIRRDALTEISYGYTEHLDRATVFNLASLLDWANVRGLRSVGLKDDIKDWLLVEIQEEPKPRYVATGVIIA